MSAYKFILLFLSFFSFCLYAEEAAMPKEEANSYRTSIQEKHLEANLLESPQYKKCKEQFQSSPIDLQAQEIQKCFDDEMKKISDADIKKLSEETNISSINTEQTKTAKGIREYLSEKIARAIQGKDYDSKKFLQKRKYVNQIQFFDLYAEQLGKNVLLETTNYCLEGIRFVSTSHPFFLSQECTNLMKDENLKDGAAVNACLKTIAEIEFPKKGDNAEAIYATIEKLQEITKEELQSQTQIYLQRKSFFCGQIISRMCDNYKCSQGTTDACQKDQQGQYLPHATSSAPSPHDVFLKPSENGIKACNVLNKLRSYRKTLADVEKIKDELLKTDGGSGYELKTAFAGEYQPGKDDSYSEITTITSREITENKNIKDLYGLEDRAKELRDKCLKGLDEKAILADKDCAELVDFDLEKKQVALETSFQAETTIRKTELEKLKDKEEIKKYLQKIGFDNLYDDSLDVEELKDIIRKHYSNEREALITDMRNRLDEKIAKKESSPNDQARLNTAIGTAITDLETQKDRLGTVLQYNNVISSFLTTEDTKSKEKSTNIVSLQREMEDFDKFKNKDDKESASEYFNNVSDGREKGSTKASGLNYMDYLDTLIGNSK